MHPSVEVRVDRGQAVCPRPLRALQSKELLGPGRPPPPPLDKPDRACRPGSVQGCGKRRGSIKVLQENRVRPVLDKFSPFRKECVVDARSENCEEIQVRSSIRLASRERSAEESCKNALILGACFRETADELLSTVDFQL